MLRHLKSTAFRVVISLGSLGLVLYLVRGQLLEAVTTMTDIDYLPVIVAVAIHYSSLVVVSLRLGLVLSVQGVRLPLLRLYYLWAISSFFNLFLPSAIGGDVAKAYYIYKDCGQKAAAVSTVFLDRFLGLMATISLGGVAFLIVGKEIANPDIGFFLMWVAIVAGTGILFIMSDPFSRVLIKIFAFILPKAINQKLNYFFEALHLYREHKRTFLMGYGYSLIAQSVFISIFFFLAISLHIEVPFRIFYLLVPLVTICSMVPSIGGLGVREASMVYLFKAYMTVEQAVALSLLASLFIYGNGVLCGILYGFRGGASVSELEQVEGA